MQPDQSQAPIPMHRGARRLNGLIWALLGTCLLLVVLLWGKCKSYAALGPLLLMVPLTALGALTNLVLALLHGVRGQGQQAKAYLLGFLLLLLCLVGQCWYATTHHVIPGKIGG